MPIQISFILALSFLSLHAQSVEAPSSLSAAKPAVTSGAVVQTPGCSSNKVPVQTDILFFQQQLLNLNGGKVSLAILPAETCYKANVRYYVSIPTEFHRVGSSDAFVQRTSGELYITAISEKTRDQLTESDAGGLGLDASAGGLASVKASLPKPAMDSKKDAPEKIYLASFRLTKKALVNYSRLIDAYPTFGTVVFGKQVDALVKAGAELIDVRSERSFLSSRHPQAKNVPYSVFNPLEIDQFKAAASYIANKDRFDLSLLPKNKKKKILFLGENEGDITPSRAMLLAKEAGYENLVFVKDGEWGRIGFPFETPKPNQSQYPEVTVEALSGLVAQGAILVDVRAAQERAYGHILKDIHIPYTLSSHNKVPLVLAEQVKAGDKFSIEVLVNKKNSPIIVYGIDETDWRALRAVIWLKSSGFSNVSWVRRGAARWVSLSFVDPIHYKIEP